MTDGDMATVRGAVAVFDAAPALEAAVDDLASTGFDRQEIGLLAATATVEAKLAHCFRKVADLAADTGAPRALYVGKDAMGGGEGLLLGGLFYGGPLAVAGGTLAAVIAAAMAAGGTEGPSRATLAKLLGGQHARQLQELLDRGGLLLWVQLRDKAHEDRATAILRRRSAHAVQVHDLPVG